MAQQFVFVSEKGYFLNLILLIAKVCLAILWRNFAIHQIDRILNNQVSFSYSARKMQ